MILPEEMHIAVLQLEKGSKSALMTGLGRTITECCKGHDATGMELWLHKGLEVSHVESLNRVYVDRCRWRTKMRQLT